MEKKHSRTPLFGMGTLVSLAATGVFFMIMVFALRSHVPAETLIYQIAFASYGSACMSGVFWIATQLFRVTLMDQLSNRIGKTD